MPIDYNKYPPNWKTEIRPRILARDGNKCKFCRVENGATMYSASAAIRGIDGRYKSTAIWFSVLNDALRFKGLDKWDGNWHIVKPVKVVLTIMHLDHDAENWDVPDERLAAGCQLCHLRYDANEKYLRSLRKGEQKRMERAAA